MNGARASRVPGVTLEPAAGDGGTGERVEDATNAGTGGFEPGHAFVRGPTIRYSVRLEVDGEFRTTVYESVEIAVRWSRVSACVSLCVCVCVCLRA